MGSMVSFTSPCVAEVVPDEERPIGPDDVRLRTLFSGISAGTELTAYRGTNPYLTKRWDDDRRLFVDGSTSFEYPVDGWGYEEVGEVVEIGDAVTGLQPGDRVWGTWGHRTSTVQSAERAGGRLLGAGVDGCQRIGHSQFAVVVRMDADRHVERFQRFDCELRPLGNRFRHAPAVGIAENYDARAGFGGGDGVCLAQWVVDASGACDTEGVKGDAGDVVVRHASPSAMARRSTSRRPTVSPSS